MDLALFKRISNEIRTFKGLPKQCLTHLQENFLELNRDTLYSILNLEYQKQMKQIRIKSPGFMNKYWTLYNRAIEENEPKGILLRLAEKAKIAPCLLAKSVLYKYIEGNNVLEENLEKTPATAKANIYLRNTNLIPDMRLAYEVYMCTLYDNLYSPSADLMKTALGQAYEVKLYEEATKLGLAFRDEEYLRKNGYDKTPDCKLEVPVAVNGFIINWIESKALFGTEEVHKEYMENQYYSYWNRFGPGLVIYWFGYIETIVDPQNKRFIICDCLPTDLVKYNDLIDEN